MYSSVTVKIIGSKLSAYYTGQGKRSNYVPADVAKRLAIKLDMLNASETSNDLHILPSNHYKSYKMNLSTTTNQTPDIIKDATHPGEILLSEFLEPLNISQYRLAKSLKVNESLISKIVHGQRGISAALSVRLGRFFGVSPGYFLNLQSIYDLRAQFAVPIGSITPLSDIA